MMLNQDLIKPVLMGSGMLTSNRRGISLLALSIGVIILSISLAVVIPRAEIEVRRKKEDRLRFVLSEFRRAATKFVRCHGRQPENISELLQDSSGNRFLRQPYVDPMTEKFDWNGFRDESGTFQIRSASDDISISGIKYSQFN